MTTYEALSATIAEFELRIFNELKTFEDDSRADCLMCYLWPCSDLDMDERGIDLRLIKKDRVLEGSGCLDAGFVREVSVSESSDRLIRFGLELLIEALVRYKFSDKLIEFIRESLRAVGRDVEGDAK